MGWLLELLVEGIREMLSQFVIDMMTLVTDMFTELLSCDLSLFEELFSVVGDLYKNVVLPMGIALLLLICVWQLFKSMFGKAGVASEDPIELVCRTGISLFFIVAAKPLVDYILAVAGTPYQWITGTDVEVSSFSEYVSVLEGLTGGLGIDSLNIAILMLIMQFVVAWNYFKMLFVIAERYVLLGVFSYTAPLAFGTGGSKATNNILASWAKMFGGQIILILLNSWCLKMFLSGYGNLNASAYGFTKFFVATLCLVGFCKVTFKLDSYLSSLGVNLGRPTTGIGALGLMMAAGRVLSHVGRGSGESSGSSSPTGTERNKFLGYSSEWGDMSTDLTSQYDSYFEEAAQTYGVPVALLKAMGKTESNFNQGAVSGAGAIGIMQLMPATAASLGVDPYDARQNIMGGAKYIAGNLERFKDYSNGLELAIAAYNAGPGAVIKYGYQIPPYKETQNYVKKVLGYLTIAEGKTESGADTESDEDLSEPYQLLKNAVTEHVDSFFSWSVTDEKEQAATESRYYQISETGKIGIDKDTYEKMKKDGENVVIETVPVTKKTVEYTLALLLNSQPEAGSGYEYKYVTSQSTFELVLKVLKVMEDGVSALKDAFFSLFSWRDFVTGGGDDTYVSNLDVSGDIFTYDTVGKGVKKVVYFNQTEEPWGSMPYGTSTIGAAGCGPTSMSIVISTLTGQTVNPQTTCAFSIQNGEYVSGVGTAHSFIGNAASNWGLTCERVGKDRMDYVVQSLKEGKMVVEICEAYTITGSGSGHFIVLTGVTRDGYITIADCASRERSTKVYSVDTIKSYGRDLSAGAFWIIGKK